MDPSLSPISIPGHDLLRRIGAGSAGEVWLARDSLGNWRAVKIVLPRPDGDAGILRRELEGLRRYEPVSRNHPALLDVLFASTDSATGALFYVLELADDIGALRRVLPRDSGPSSLPTDPFDPTKYQPDTLSRRLRRAATAESPPDRRLPAAEVPSLGRQLASGLACLHEAGLVHRDIKPSNVVFVGGRPCLADCGLVSLSAVARSFVGTEGFIPPEGPGSPAADAYALGKVIYEAALGLDRIDWPELPGWFGTAPDLPLLRELLAVMRRACASDPSARYRDAGEMLADLTLLANGGSMIRQGELRGLPRRLAFAAMLAATIVSVVIWRIWASPLSTTALPARLVDLQDVQPVDVVPEKPHQLEFYAISGNQLQFLTSVGEVSWAWSPPDSRSVHLRLDWARGPDGTVRLQRYVSWTAGTNCHIAVLSQYNERELHRWTTPGQVITNAGGGLHHLSVLRPEWVGDLDGDGPPELVAVLEGDPSRRTNLPPLRQLIVFDFFSGTKKWAADLTAPFHGGVVQVTNLAGGVAILAGTIGPGNGHRLPDGTDDSSSRIYAFGPRGERL